MTFSSFLRREAAWLAANAKLRGFGPAPGVAAAAPLGGGGRTRYSAASTRSAPARSTETSWLTPRSCMVTPIRRSMRAIVKA